MSIDYLILGYISWQPMTGYDIKKIISDSETLPWTANNNQIYRALVTLHNNQWVSKTVEEQAGTPNRHIYTITEAGQNALTKWVLESPEPPTTKKPFFNQLMWAEDVDGAELDKQLDAYIDALGEKLFLIRVQADEKPNMPQRSTRETYLWEMIQKNWIAQYELELQWARQVRQDLQTMEAERQRELARQSRRSS